MDSQGRVTLPPSWRKRIHSSEVIMIEDGDLILLIPKGQSKLQKYFDFIKTEVLPDIYADYHQLKNYLRRGHKE
ncbi:MAG: AbrB/MazE/SpoVT family DNA-binding domain-containing protein [Candidatus Hodarchaeales archaeon]